MTDREVMQMALEALNEVTGWQLPVPMRVMDEVEDAIEALRTALAQPDWTTDTPVPPFKYFDSPEYKIAQPEQEPVCDKDPYYCGYVRCQLGKVCKNTAPPKREWVGLTDEEIDWIFGLAYADDMELLRTIEAALKEKNT